MEYIQVLLPSIGVGLIFWYVMRGILRSDTTEREEMEKYYRQIDAEESARADEPAIRDDEGKSAHGPRDESRAD